VAMFISVRLGQIHELSQQQWILQDTLDRFDQVRFERHRQLLAWVARA